MKKSYKFLDWLKSSKSDFVLFLVALVLLNLVATRAFLRIDLTSPKSYSLSSASVETVKNLAEPLSIKVFFSKNLPSPYNSVETYLRDLLSEYKSKSKKFDYEFYDMSKQANEAIARGYDLSEVEIQEVRTKEVGLKKVWMALALVYADRIEAINGINSTESLEYKLTTAINRMVSTTATLENLEGQVKLTLYVSKELADFEIQGFSEIENTVKSAFEKINRKNLEKLSFEQISPEQQEIPLLVQKYGLQGLIFNDKNGEQKNAVIGLVLQNGEDFRVLPLKMTYMPFFGNLISGLNQIEDATENALKSLVTKTVEIGYVTGHGELPLFGDSFNGGPLPTKLSQIASDMYEFREINLSSEEIPAQIKTIIVNGAKSILPEDELYKLDQFLMKGGSLMVFQGPFDEVQDPAPSSFVPQNIFNERVTGLESLLLKYGISLEYAYIFDENCYVDMNQNYGELRLYFAPMVQKENLNQKSPISKNLGYVIFLENGIVDVQEAQKNPELKTTILAKSSAKSWRKSENIILNPLFISPSEGRKNQKSENLAVLIEGHFKSAYDKEILAIGSEVESQNEDQKSQNAVSISNHIEKSILPGKIFVSASDEITTAQLVDDDGKSPQAIFLRNALDYLSGSEELCEMRTKGLSLNTLKDIPDAAKKAAQIFNMSVPAILTAILGLLAWHHRSSRRKKIRMKYNPSDSRQLDLKKIENQKNEKLKIKKSTQNQTEEEK